MLNLIGSLSREEKMPQPLNLGNCCGPAIPGIRRVAFPDGDQVGLISLDAVMKALYKAGKLPDDSTAKELTPILFT